MDVLDRHRKTVRNWRDQLERMLDLHARIFDAQKQTWALRSQYSPETEQEVRRLHETIDNMTQEIDLIREAFFGNLQRAATKHRPAHALVADARQPARPSGSDVTGGKGSG